MNATKPDPLLTASEVASVLGVPVKRVRRAIRTGALPAYQLGEWWRVRESDAAEWLERQRFCPMRS